MMMLEQKDLLPWLTAPKQKAVTTTKGPVLILAGPGSGKTRVITHRIAYVVQDEQVSPWYILAVTLTNKAAKEMRERLEKLVGVNESKEMMIGTFHAICARVLRIEADYLAPLGLNRSFVILDASDQTTLIKRAIKDLDLDEKQYKLANMQALISRAKNDMQSPDQMAERAAKYTEEVAARIYKAYQKHMRANNSAAFDDLLLLTDQLWRPSPGVRRKKDKRQGTALGQGEKSSVHQAYDEEDEGQFVGHEIQRLLARGEVKQRGDIAVMYRTNAQSRALEEQFMRLNIPYKVIGSRKFYERKAIQPILTYLRLLINPYDDC